MRMAFVFLVLFLVLLFAHVFISIEQIDGQLSAQAAAIIAIAKKMSPNP